MLVWRRHVVGVQFVMISGEREMLKLFVDNLVMGQMVSFVITNVTVPSLSLLILYIYYI